MFYSRSLGLAAGLLLAISVPSLAQEPQRGGIFNYGTERDPGSFDCHVGTDVFTIQRLAPHYSTLLRYSSERFPEVEGDLATSWEVSPDGLTYTFKIPDNVKFHNGYDLTSTDVKASYDRIINPPEGLASARKAELVDVSAVEAPDPTTVIIRLAARNPSILTSLANPWNCILSSKLLAEDADYPAKKVIGSGAFVFDAFVPGSSWKGRRFDGYFKKGLPYLDEFEILTMDTNSIVNALGAAQIKGYLRQLTPPQQAQITNVRGEDVVFQGTPAIGQNLVTFNPTRKPYDDPRVRRALTLAIDRYEGAKVLEKSTYSKHVGALLRPGFSMAMTPEALEKMPGFSHDIEASRAEARRLLAEAGVPDLKVQLFNRNLPLPNIALGIYLVDQWQRIGVQTVVSNIDDAGYFARIRSGDFDVSIDFNVPVSDDPTVVFAKYLPGSPTNYARHDDPVLADLYEKQKRLVDVGERQKLVTQIEIKILEDGYYLPLHWLDRTIGLSKEVRGFKVTPNNQVGISLETVWLAP